MRAYSRISKAAVVVVRRNGLKKTVDKSCRAFNLRNTQRMSFFLKAGIAIAGSVFFMALASAQTIRVQGKVRDTTASAVADAAVNIRCGEFSATANTDSNGEFTFAQVPNGPGLLEVTAPGFSEARISWNAAPNSEIEIVLKPARVSEEVVVSATRSEIRLSETPGSMVRLSKSDVADSPSLTVDDMLRQVPGFSLFRRSSSRTANPTSQGVSLRGLGASGPSRALVLEDGIPLLDPFGGWVYWNRIPPVEVSSVEVFRGGASNLYGSDALGGVIQFISREAEKPAFSLETSYGNEQTPNVSLWAGDTIGKWNLDAATDLFRSDGYVLVPSSQSGTVDTAANSEHATVDLNVGYRLGPDAKIFARGNFYHEFRNNGTPVQTNDTQIEQGAAGFDKQFGPTDSVSVRAFGDVQGYNQRFSSIASDRGSESLTDIQHVPAQQLGGTGQWTHALGKSQTLIVGGDLQEVIGSSDEQLFSAGTHTANNIAGGRQRVSGVFGEDIFQIHRKWTLILGARFDDWRNFDGSSVRIPISKPGPAAATNFPDRTDTAFNPRLSVLRSLNRNFSVTGSAYRAFRAPTLNELYRSFRLGSVVTNSNAGLRAERLTGAEAGLNFTGLNQKLELRGTFFWSDIVNPVANVTLSTTPSLITRQRQNLGRTRSRGLELDSVVHLTRSIQVSAGYDYTDATVLRFPVNTALQGLDIPQVPRHSFTWEARYWNPKVILLSVQGRFIGRQFDDDQNQLPLGSFYAMDFLAGRSLTRHLEIFAAAENILNQQYMVARTPITNLGPPVLFRIGLKLNYPSTR
jgi:outer membrane receptor protein involved in Fe transport